MPALVKQRFEAGEHRYEVVRYDGSKARPKGLMEVVKWATIESNAALAISNGGQIIYSKQGWRPSPQTMVCAPSSSGSTCLGGQKRERNRTKLRRRPRRQPGRHARAGVRGPSQTQRVTQAEPVAIGSSSAWEFQRDLRKEQRRRESGAFASLISTLDHDLTLCSFAGRVGVPRPLCSSFPAG